MFDMIQRQAVDIATQEAERRAKKEQPSGTVTSTPLVLGGIKSLPQRGGPLRAWAELAAHHLSYDEWDAIVSHCEGTVRPFRGDVIRFFENAFAELRLKDGRIILP
jgi:hypothetical protein